MKLSIDGSFQLCIDASERLFCDTSKRLVFACWRDRRTSAARTDGIVGQRAVTSCCSGGSEHRDLTGRTVDDLKLTRMFVDETVLVHGSLNLSDGFSLVPCSLQSERFL